jgi:hypothetical protein
MDRGVTGQDTFNVEDSRITWRMIFANGAGHSNNYKESHGIK